MNLIFASIVFFFSFGLLSQSEYVGVWQGMITKNGGNPNPFYLKITNEKSQLSILSREEVLGTELFAIGQYQGKTEKETLELKQLVFQKKEGNSRTSWCKIVATLKYNTVSGYLEGDFSSSDCRNVNGKIILFKSKALFSEEKSPFVSQNAVDILIKDLSQNRYAPAIRELERSNFKFESIYFDYDKSFIRDEDTAFLTKIVAVINGHTDLRIKVIGNTDADGSDAYNDDLSKRRAEAIIEFFVAKGLSKDRIEIQFNGEKMPIDRNDTPEGKQRNRRVEFEFI